MNKQIVFLLVASFSLASFQAVASDPVPEDYVPIPKRLAKTVLSKKGELPLKYSVEIAGVDGELKTLLMEYLPLITQQKQEELDREQMDFLAEEAPEQVKTMLKTKGYFNGQVKISQSKDAYLVQVNPGPRTHVNDVSVAIVGSILQDNELALYYKNAMNNWSLPIGEGFDQSEWTSSKNSVLSAVTRKKYPLAQVSHSQATIDPNQKTAALNVVVDSQQPIYFGEVHVSGTKRYPESVVRGLARFKSGDPYDLDRLLDYQQALEQDGHYSGASVQADFKNLQQDRVPVLVNISEVKRHKFEVGLRFDSEDGLGGRLGYDYYNLFNKGYIGSLVLDGDKYQTTFAVGISQPRNNKGMYWTSNVSYSRSTTQNLEKKVLTSGLWRVRDRDNIDARLGVEFITESRRVPHTSYDLGRSHATMLTASWRCQEIEAGLRPQNGYYFDGKIGTTIGKLLSSTYIGRATGHAGYYFTPEDKKIGTFILRGQLGYIYAKENDEVPASLQFRTGGATSIRGYELDSIGLNGPDGSVLPQRSLAVASFEYQYAITKNFSGAIFHDVGDAARNFKRMNLKHGTGIGVRWFSPVAPFSFDIAYGHHDKKLRWHISLGTRF